MKSILKTFAAALFLFPAALSAQTLDELAAGLSGGIKGEKPLKMAVLTFPYVDGFNSSGSRIVQERMLTALAGNDKFNLLERGLLHKVLEQKKLEMSGLFDESTGSELGRMLGVDAVLTGTLLDINDSETEVNARIIDSGSGEVLASGKAVLKRIWSDKVELPRPIFIPTQLPDVPDVKAPAAVFLEGGYDDIDTLEKYDEAVKFDKGRSAPRLKEEKWRQFALVSDKHSGMALKRAQEWADYAVELDKAEELRKRRLEAMQKDYQVLKRYLALEVVTRRQKADWAEKFMETYGAGNIYAAEVTAYLPTVCVDPKTHLYGFCYRDGTVLIKHKYLFASLFQEGLAPVSHFDGNGYIDKDGKEVIPPKYQLALNFSEGLGPVELNDKWGYIDKKGNVVIPFEYGWVSPFSEGLAYVGLKGKVGYIDRKGKAVTPLKYHMANPFSDGRGMVVIKEKGKYRSGFVDKSGKEVIPVIYDNAWPFSEGLSAASLDKGGDSGNFFMDRQGVRVFDFYGSSFSEGLSCAMKGNWGFMDRNGETVIPYKFGQCNSFSEGLAAVNMEMYSGKWGYIDRNGRQVIDFKYDEAEMFSEGLAPVKMNGKWGYIDRQGGVALPFRYEEAGRFTNGTAYVTIKGRGMHIDRWGNF